jgi:hypothetical protein
MRKAILLSLSVLLLGCLTSRAQDTGEIVGTVTDSTGGVIPGAKVTVSNPAKSFTRELLTGATGSYDAPKLPIGSYLVTAQAQGFEKLVRAGLTLEVGQILRVDLQMRVGQVTQEVTVTGQAPLVETQSGTVSDVVTSAQITNFPLNGRNFEALYLLVPGAVPDDSFDPTQIGIAGFAAVSFNGNRMEYNNMEIDGGNNADEGSGPSSINTFPSLDSIAEFRVSSSNYGADQGRHAGAQIEVATKAGTRDFHGDAYEYVRNDHFDANDWFINRTPWSSLDVNANCDGNVNGPCNAPKTPLKWNDFGYTLGGPFYIPGHYNTSKTKTFFFWSEEWRKYRQGTVIGPMGVPTVRMRNGDFSECDAKSPNYNSVVAEGCILPPAIAGQPVDTVPIDPNAQTLLNAYIPLPNNGPDSYVAAHSQPTNWREEQIRVDQNISEKTTAFLRFTNDAWNTNWATEQWASWGAPDSINTPFNGPAKSGVFHVTHNFHPNLMNEFIMSYTVDHIFLTDVPGAGSVSHSITKPSNWSVGNLFTSNAANPLLSALEVCGGQPFCGHIDGGNLPWKNSNPVIQWKDNVVDIKGNHTLKFGFLLSKYRKNEQFGTDTQGILSFDAGGPITTGNALVDMYLGNIGAYQEGTTTINGVPVGGYAKGHWRSTEFEPYFQDDWKVTRKLTLNLGVRYYYFVPIHDVSRPQPVDSDFIPSLYNPTAQAQLDSNGNLIPGSGQDYTTFGNGLVECGKNGIVRGCHQVRYFNLAPRFGFAYDFTGAGRTVLRGGYGIFFEPGNGNETNTEGGEGNPPVTLSPSGYNLVGYQAIVPGAVGPTGYTALPYHAKWGSVQQYNLTLEHQFGNDNVLSVAYVGTLGRHLASSRALNQIPVGIGTMTVPALANFSASNDFGTPQSPSCDASGNCNVQAILINNVAPSNALFAPYRGYSGITMKDNTANSEYNALQTNFRHTFGRGLTLQAAYTWEHNIDNSTSAYFGTSVDDNFNLNRWRATSDLNRTHVLVMNYIYELPFFKSSTSRLARNGLGGWRISGITSFFTGQPIDFGCGVTDPISGSSYQTGIGASVRCNSLGPVKIQKGTFDDPTFGPTPTWWNPNMVAEPLPSQFYANNQPGMFGYMGRNFLTGPGRNNWDLALHKDIQLPWLGGEKSTVQFRWETTNTFNHPQWGGPNGVSFGNHGIGGGCNGAPNNDNTPAFGRPCGGATYNLGNGEVGAAWPPRIMQFALKFTF